LAPACCFKLEASFGRLLFDFYRCFLLDVWHKHSFTSGNIFDNNSMPVDVTAMLVQFQSWLAIAHQHTFLFDYMFQAIQWRVRRSPVHSFGCSWAPQSIRRTWGNKRGSWLNSIAGSAPVVLYICKPFCILEAWRHIEATKNPFFSCNCRDGNLIW
jgi:hypothetical protein